MMHAGHRLARFRIVYFVSSLPRALFNREPRRSSGSSARADCDAHLRTAPASYDSLRNCWFSRCSNLGVAARHTGNPAKLRCGTGTSYGGPSVCTQPAPLGNQVYSTPIQLCDPLHVGQPHCGLRSVGKHAVLVRTHGRAPRPTGRCSKRPDTRFGHGVEPSRPGPNPGRASMYSLPPAAVSR
jgi:hypothetical protein